MRQCRPKTPHKVFAGNPPRGLNPRPVRLKLMSRKVEEGTATQEETPRVYNRGNGCKIGVMKHMKAAC